VVCTAARRLMRKLLAAALLLLLPAVALAQDALPIETIESDGLDSLTGVWKITMPEGFKASLFGKTEWGPTIEDYCRFEEIGAALTFHCPGLRLGGKYVSRGTVTLDKGHIRLIFGSAFMRFGMVGTLHSDAKFDGTFFIEYVGISSDAPAKSVGEKMSLSETTPDKAGKSALLARLFQQMAQGGPTEPFDAHAMTMRFLKPDDLHPLGTIQTIIYLGEVAPGTERPSSVYDVEFANGNLICQLRQRDDNTLDYFDCG
jgi:hypothetical protein